MTVTTDEHRELYGCPAWCIAEHETFDGADAGAFSSLSHVVHEGPSFGPGVNGWAVEVGQLGDTVPRIYVGPGDEFLDEEAASKLAEALGLAVGWIREQADAGRLEPSGAGSSTRG